MAIALRRLHWFEQGAKLEEWPESDSDDYVCLIIWDREGFRFFEDGPFALPVENAFWAFGCGRDFALAAMHCGKDAREAVEIASRFDNGCGLGVDVMTLNG